MADYEGQECSCAGQEPTTSRTTAVVGLRWGSPIGVPENRYDYSFIFHSIEDEKIVD